MVYLSTAFISSYMLQLQFQPFPVLYTDRCRLRSITLQDAPQLYKLRTNEQVLQYVDREKATSLAEVEVLIRKIQVNAIQNEAIGWAITLRNEDTMIGDISFWRVQKEHYRAEIGYALLPQYWQQGLMSEVIKEVIRYGFQQMKLHSIEANVNPQNKASIQLLLKHGFVQEAYFKENYYFRGRFLDSAVYSLITAERP